MAARAGFRWLQRLDSSDGAVPRPVKVFLGVATTIGLASLLVLRGEWRGWRARAHGQGRRRACTRQGADSLDPHATTLSPPPPSAPAGPRSGKDLASSEKPEALRGEAKRSLEVEKAKIAAAAAAPQPPSARLQ
jgi:hypothetical protein